MKKTTPNARKKARAQHHQHRASAHSAPSNAAVSLVEKITSDAIEARIRKNINTLRTSAGLHSHLGDNAATICHQASHLLYITYYAADLHGLADSPDACILASTANGLTELAKSPAQLHARRASIISALDAIDRLMPKLHTMSLAMGEMHLNSLLDAAADISHDELRALVGEPA